MLNPGETGMRMRRRVRPFFASYMLSLTLFFVSTIQWGQGNPGFDLAKGPLELSGPAEPWRFVNAVGEKAGIWGFESGVLEG
jgi:hypothetical protein